MKGFPITEILISLVAFVLLAVCISIFVISLRKLLPYIEIHGVKSIVDKLWLGRIK